MSWPGAAWQSELYFPCCSPRRHARKMIQPFPLLTLQNISTTSSPFGASAPRPPPGSCKMERMAVTRRRTTGSSVQFSAALRLTGMRAGALRSHAQWARRAEESSGCIAGLCRPACVRHRDYSHPVLAFGLLRRVCLSPFVSGDLNESERCS